VLQKCGMSLEGRLRENLLMRGEWRDSLLYAILDHEWNKRIS
jgi:RimJ/RimL family protein N-acetyltransferase